MCIYSSHFNNIDINISITEKIIVIRTDTLLEMSKTQPADENLKKRK